MQTYNNFITNDKSKKNLKERINQLISQSQELKFLVGYFYFSGLSELYESLSKNQDLKLKILVGLNIDRLNYQFVEYEQNRTNKTNNEIIESYLDSIVKLINQDSWYDKKDFYNMIKTIIDLIQQDKIIIRKTLESNHAKLYIFKLKEEQIVRPSLFITGSSNLTYPGLNLDREFNVEISDYGTEDAEKYFENLWNRSIKITEDNIIKQRLIQAIEEKTILKKITPFEAYVYLLKSYLETYSFKDEHDQLMHDLLKKNDFTPYRYQLDAVKQALSIIEKYNGVIIADVVGLGKTIIACLIGAVLNKRGLVLCPPTLQGERNLERSGWAWYLERFGLYHWEVLSIGKIDEEDFVQSVKQYRDIEIVIVDEAHRFRNDKTLSYANLKEICRNKIVILLTATPYNNRPGDIYSLLQLFVVPKQSDITFDNDLELIFSRLKTTFEKLAYIKKYHNSNDQEKLKKAKEYYKYFFDSENINLKEVDKLTRIESKKIRSIIEPVIIRRNRLDLKKHPQYKQEIQELSEVKDPEEWYFELNKDQSKFYDEIIEYFSSVDENENSKNSKKQKRFTGAIYQPLRYKKSEKSKEKEDIKEIFEMEQQKNLYDFMRRLLVKRFESSFGAFRESIIRFKTFHENFLDFMKKTNKILYNRKLLNKIYSEEENFDKQIEEFKRKLEEQNNQDDELNYYDLKDFDQEKLKEDIDNDIKLFDDILKKLDELKLIENDPKLDTLINNIKTIQKKEKNRKIIIFSEYLDTVKYLEGSLQKEFNGRVLVVKESLTQSKIEQINKNFNASYNKNQQEDQYDILLGTDRISEGLNLNRAGMIINYDIPWNPVRIIQRLGRINRIGKKVFDKLYVVNFFPSEKGADLIKSREIAAQKLFLIHNVLGEDSKILEPTEEPTPSKLFERIQKNPEEYEAESLYTQILNEFEEIKNQYPDVLNKIKDMPPRIKIAKSYNNNELLVFTRKNRLYIHKIDYQDSKQEIEEVLFEDILDHIRCKMDEKELVLSDNFWENYEKIKNYKQKESQKIPSKSAKQLAINNIKTLRQKQEYKIYKDFLDTLLEDILEYGTLPEYTLVRIKEMDANDIENTLKELNKLKEELGENYLDSIKEKTKNIEKEIIIAIENQTVN